MLGPALLVQLAATIFVYAREYQPIAYVDANGQSVAYNLFFYNESQRGFDEASTTFERTPGRRRSWRPARHTGFICAPD